jgi:hypothetical protein
MSDFTITQELQDLYSVATRSLLSFPQNIYECRLDEYDHWDSKGKHHTVEVKLNGDTIEFPNKPTAINFLSEREYKISRTEYPHTTYFINEGKKKEYDDLYQTVKIHNDERLAAIEKLIEYFKKNLSENFPKVFVRFGKIPLIGKSYNYRDKVYEEGVSCYYAWNVRGKYVIDVVGGPFLYSGYKGSKSLYLVKGDKLDVSGSDGEPLLGNCQIIKKIKTDKFCDVKEFIVDVFEEE